MPLLSADHPLFFFFFFLPSELSEEKELVAEALEKGTLPLLKEQVR